MSESRNTPNLSVDAVLLQAQFEHGQRNQQHSHDAEFHINHAPEVTHKMHIPLHIPGAHGLGYLIRRMRHSPRHDQMVDGAKEYGEQLRDLGNPANILENS